MVYQEELLTYAKSIARNALNKVWFINKQILLELKKSPSTDEKTVGFQNQQSCQCWCNDSDSTKAIHSMLISAQMTKQHELSLLCTVFLGIWILHMSKPLLRILRGNRVTAYVGFEQIPSWFWMYLKIQKCKNNFLKFINISKSETFKTKTDTFEQVVLFERKHIRLLKPWKIGIFSFFLHFFNFIRENESGITWVLLAKIGTLYYHCTGCLELLKVFEFWTISFLVFLKCFSHHKSQCGSFLSLIQKSSFFLW